jgi:hypothetical protein
LSDARTVLRLTHPAPEVPQDAVFAAALLLRNIGSLSTPDLLFVVLIADAAQHAMAGDSVR